MKMGIMYKVVLLMFIIEGLVIAAGVHHDPTAGLSRTPYQSPHEAGALVLRSKEFHGGDYDWQIVRYSHERHYGGAVSDPAFIEHTAYDAIVPGTVLNTLVHHNVYPEPYFGLNNANEKKLIPDLNDVGHDFYTYWFRTEFELSKAFDGKEVMMRFDGINYRAEIWLNGTRLGDMAGMFTRGFFNITDAVNRKGKNVLAVLVRPVDVPGGFRNKFKEVRAAGENRNGGDGQIGKNVTMLMSVGWDFTFSDGIRDRNTGIWKDITIFPVASVELRDPFIKSDLAMPEMDVSQIGRASCRERV